MASTVGNRLSLLTVVALAATFGILAPSGSHIADADLSMLLRFMAAMKATLAIGAFAMAEWRLRAHAPRAFVTALIAAVSLMAAASGLIWSLRHVALGAALFHLGLLAFLGLSWQDGTAKRLAHRLARRMPRYGLATATATSFLRKNGSVQGGS